MSAAAFSEFTSAMRVIYPRLTMISIRGGAESSPVQRDSFYLVVSALAPYKKIDMAIETFSAMGQETGHCGRRAGQCQTQSTREFLHRIFRLAYG